MSIKSDLLRYLEENRDIPLSGQALAEKLSVSRAAVWKAMKSLEGEGHRITAAPNKGYRLETSSDVLSAEGFRCHLPPAYCDIPIFVENRVDSTNTLAKKLAADGAENGTVILADEQTGGRGRRGRSFFSPAGTGIYMSLILRPNAELAELPILTIAAAAAVCEAVERLYDCPTQIKWVNDIFVGGRKICGILTEAAGDFESGRAESVIVGVGVNVGVPAGGFPPALRETAGCLPPGGDEIPLSRNALAAEIAGRLLDYAGELKHRPFLKPYRQRSMVLGKAIRYRQGETWREGIAQRINEDGHLIVKTPGGHILLRAGEIQMEVPYDQSC